MVANVMYIKRVVSMKIKGIDSVSEKRALEKKSAEITHNIPKEERRKYRGELELSWRLSLQKTEVQAPSSVGDDGKS